MAERKLRMRDDLRRTMRTWLRYSVAQSIGIFGLLWCLFDRQPYFGVGLACLLLLDQAIFLRSRAVARSRPWPTTVEWVCLVIGVADAMILCATLYQAAGLREVGSNAVVTDPLDHLAYALASFARVGVGLSAASPGGRLLTVVEGVAGAAVFLTAGAALLTAMLYGRSEAPALPEPPQEEAQSEVG